MRHLQLDLLKLRPETFASAQKFAPKPLRSEIPSFEHSRKLKPSNYTIFRPVRLSRLVGLASIALALCAIAVKASGEKQV
jgi:hypothetical protein